MISIVDLVTDVRLSNAGNVQIIFKKDLTPEESQELTNLIKLLSIRLSMNS